MCLTRSLILAMASKPGTSSLFHEDPGMILNLGGEEGRREEGEGGRRREEEGGGGRRRGGRGRGGRV